MKDSIGVAHVLRRGIYLQEVTMTAEEQLAAAATHAAAAQAAAQAMNAQQNAAGGGGVNGNDGGNNNAAGGENVNQPPPPPPVLPQNNIAGDNNDVSMATADNGNAGFSNEAVLGLVQALQVQMIAQADRDKGKGQQIQRRELTTAITWNFYGIEDRDHPNYLNPETFINEVDNRIQRFEYSGQEAIGFFKMSLRGPAASWYAGLESLNRGRTRICIDDWYGLRREFREHHGIGGKLFYLDFRELLFQRKGEKVGPYVARVREGIDKFLQHFGDKMFSMALPKKDNLLYYNDDPPSKTQAIRTFQTPLAVITEVDNIIRTAATAWPVEQRLSAERTLEEVKDGLGRNVEEACRRYLRKFLAESKPDFYHFFHAKVEWFDCIHFIEDVKLREYALNSARTAFQKEVPMSTVSLWNMIEQKERTLTRPGKYFQPPPIATVSAVSGLTANEKDDIMRELLNSGDYGDLGSVDVGAMRAAGKAAKKKKGKKGKGGGGHGGGGGAGSAGQAAGGGGGAGGNRPFPFGGASQGGPQHQRRQQGPGYDKWCTHCNRAGHDYDQCRNRVRTDYANRQIVHPRSIPPGPSQMAPVSVGAQLGPIGAPAQPPQQQGQSLVSSIRAIGTEAATSGAAAPIWSPPLYSSGIDR